MIWDCNPCTVQRRTTKTPRNIVERYNSTGMLSNTLANTYPMRTNNKPGLSTYSITKIQCGQNQGTSQRHPRPAHPGISKRSYDDLIENEARQLTPGSPPFRRNESYLKLPPWEWRRPQFLLEYAILPRWNS